MIQARWDKQIRFDAFVDHEREKIGNTQAEPSDVESAIDTAKDEIKNWMKYYFKSRWENQPIYAEVWIEKKALISSFERICRNKRIALCPCKGYPSLTFLEEARSRYMFYRGKKIVILYFGDYDPSGEDIPRSIEENLNKMGVDVEVRRILLMEEQVIEMGLPPAPTKKTDTRSVHWDGLGQVELDAIEPRELSRLAEVAIDSVFDDELYDELKEMEKTETEKYRNELKEFVKTL